MKLNVRIDDTLISLISDYHGIKPIEVIATFSGYINSMLNNEGNINEYNMMWKGDRLVRQKKTESDKQCYALRGYYPNTKVPFKISGVNSHGYANFVVALGDKNRHTKFTQENLKKIEDIVAENILLDSKTDDDNLYKQKNFKCMRPEGLPLLSKGN